MPRTFQITDEETQQPLTITWDGPEGTPPSRRELDLLIAKARATAPPPPKSPIARVIDLSREMSADLESTRRQYPAFGGELWAARKAAEASGALLAKVRRPVDIGIGLTLRAAAQRSKAKLATMTPEQRAAFDTSYGSGSAADQEAANERRLASAERLISGGATLGSEERAALGPDRTKAGAVGSTLLTVGTDFASDPANIAIGGLSSLGRLGAQLQYVLGAALSGAAGMGAVRKAGEIGKLASEGKLNSPQAAAAATEAVLDTLMAGFGAHGAVKGLALDAKLGALELKEAADYYAKRTGLGPEAASKTFREALRSLGDSPDPRTPEFQRLVAELRGAAQKQEGRAAAYKMDAQTAKDTADIARREAVKAESMGNFRENASPELAQRFGLADESARLEKAAVREQIAGQNPAVSPNVIDPRLATPEVARATAEAQAKTMAAEEAVKGPRAILGRAQARVTTMENQRAALTETPPQVADLVERLGSAVRGQQFARSFEWKPALRESRQKIATELTALRRRFAKGELTVEEYTQEAGSIMAQKAQPPSVKGVEFAPDELDALHTHIASSPDLTPFEAQRARAALDDLVGGTSSGADRKLITKGDVELLNVAFGKGFLDAQFTKPFPERLTNAKDRAARVRAAVAPFENDLTAARNALAEASKNLSRSARAEYKAAAAPILAKIRSSYKARVEAIRASLKAEAAPKRAAYEAAVEARTEAGKAATRASHRGQELLDLLDPQEGAVGSVKPPSYTRRLTNLAADLAFGATRAVSASDLGSWILRQGAMLTYHGIFTRPGQTARTVGGGIADYFSKSRYRDITRTAIDSHPAQTLVKPMGLRLGNQGEGLYESSIAHKLPVISEALVKPSERSFHSLDKLRLDMASMWDSALREKGYTPETHPEMYKAAGDLLNAFTGTSRFPKVGGLDTENAAGLLGSLAFAPRYVYSTVSLPFKMAKAAVKAPPVARLGAGPTAAFVAAWMGTLAAGKYLLGAEVETDPRSSDFLKLKIGNTRFDLGRGLVQAMVLGARLGTGEYKSSSTGEVERFASPRDIVDYARTNVWPKHPKGDTNALTLLYRFLESKEAPVPSYISDVLRGGKDIMGRPADLNPITRFQPFAKRDIEEAAKSEPATVPAVALASQFGVGAQSYTAQSTKSPEEQEAEKLRKEQGAGKPEKTDDEKSAARLSKVVRAGHEAKIRRALKAGDTIAAYDAWLEAKINGYPFPDLKKQIMQGYDTPDDEEN